GGEVNWTAFSDGRFKNNLNEDVPGLEFITKLRPITYTLDIEGIDTKLKANMPKVSIEDNNEAAKVITLQEPSAEERKAKAEKAKVKYTGFVAQEVEAVAKKLNYDFSGVDVPKNKEDFYGLRYAEFVVPLVKAVQEQQLQIDELKQQNKELKELFTKLMNRQEINTTINVSGASLEQNVPNPNNGSTTIRYHLPQSAGNAQIVITNMKGQVLKSINLNSRGDGQITLNASTLPAGSYNYTLYVEGKSMDNKKMLIVK
ncbi:MAG TPA: tail fiber domain-containing protein, partial [Chitinophagaceae bacterium]|nr:tail fiber domain-containing protein [Chitinophagaceae bacterium]